VPVKSTERARPKAPARRRRYERQRRVLNAKEPAGCRRYKGKVKNAGRRPAVQKTKATSLEKTREKTKLEKTKEGRDADAEE
jgi:hypothetical protein